MRLGAPLFEKVNDPQAWAAALVRLGYSAAYCPVGADADEATIRAYSAAATKAGIVIAEVGAWSNPLEPDAPLPDWQRDSIGKVGGPLAYCKQQLALAERIGARCCVNIVGSRDPGKWDGPHPDNYSAETFDRIVENVREIIDDVKPTRTHYSLETMPWAPPDSADSYLALIKAIDRPRFGVHLDPVNLINSPRLAYRTADLLRECFAKFGPLIRSCHAKDIRLSSQLTVHLDECVPGTGLLDYAVFLREMAKIDPDTPLLLEHLPAAEQYASGIAHVRSVASTIGVSIR